MLAGILNFWQCFLIYLLQVWKLLFLRVIYVELRDSSYLKIQKKASLLNFLTFRYYFRELALNIVIFFLFINLGSCYIFESVVLSDKDEKGRQKPA